MSKRKTTQYAWGTERPSSKLDKIEARRRPLKRELDLIEALSTRESLLRLRQEWVDLHQATHIRAATMYGSYNPDAATKYPWVEECQSEKLNLLLEDIETNIDDINASKTDKEIEFDKKQAVLGSLRNRLCHLANYIGNTDRNINCKLSEIVPANIPDAVKMLGLKLRSEEVYFAFYGMNETFLMPDNTLGHPDFHAGWSNALQPPTDIRAAFPCFCIPTLPPEMMPEDAAWLWVRPLLFDGGGEMPPPWRQKALQSYGGRAATALAVLLEEDASLKDRYLAEQARQFMWPFFVERRERLRFHLRLYQMEDIELDEIQQAMAEFDERESPIQAAANALRLADHKALTPVFDRIFELLPWPDQFGPTLGGIRTR